MRVQSSYDYALVRVVPRVERGEFVNVGAIASSDALGFLEARFAVEEGRLLAIDRHIDLSGRLPLRERFHWLVAPRSTIIQTSAVHTGRCSDIEATIESVLERMVRPL